MQAGFTDISGDLMLALPAYTMAELDETIALLAESGCTHISGYLLKIEPNTVFGKRPPEALPDDDAAADFYLAAVEKLAALGYAQYEISNFARPSFESRHNRIYWDCGDYLGLGPTAHSCMAASALPRRRARPRSLPRRGVRTPGRMHRRRLHHAPAPSFPRAFIERAARAVRRILLLRKAPVPANACGAWAGCFRRQRPAPDAPGNAGSEQHPVRACVKLFYCPVHFLSISKKHPAQALCRSAGRSSLQVSYDLTFL